MLFEPGADVFQLGVSNTVRTDVR